MPVTRNPFRLRASEQAATDELFLFLFSARVLDVLPHDSMWDRLVLLTSAPGGGKSTLLRLFTPRILARVIRSRGAPEFEDLASRLAAIDAIRDSPQIIGVLINCDEQYATIEDLPYDDAVRMKLYFSLLDARVTLHTLRAIAQFANLEYPAGLSMVRLVPTEMSSTTALATSADDIYVEAQSAETEITRVLNSLVAIQPPNTGRRQLNFLRTLSTHEIRVDERPLTARILVMFDDAHRLSSGQRSALRADLQNKDLQVARWLAMRSEALAQEELVGEATSIGREYAHVRIEEWWNRAYQQFATWLGDVADRRTKRAEIDLGGFASCLADKLGTSEERNRIHVALEASRAMAMNLAQEHGAFADWPNAVTKTTDEFEQAVRWRALCFLMERRLSKQLPLDIPLPSEEAVQINEADERKAAALFLSKEHRIPYYFGTDAIAQLGSSNVEQYLGLAAKLFDRFLASGVGRSRPTPLTASQQDALIRQASQERLDSIPRDMPYGRDMQKLVYGIGRLCADQTFRRQASYAPGVSAVAISMEDRDRLARAATDHSTDAASRRLFDVLTAAIAHNVLEPKLNHKTKGKRWMVLYLNRLLCPAFQLPLRRSHHKEVTLQQLAHWITNVDAQTRLAM